MQGKDLSSVAMVIFVFGVGTSLPTLAVLRWRQRADPACDLSPFHICVCECA